MGFERSYNAAVDFVDRNVTEGHGGKVAFVDPWRELTYAELCEAAARVGPMLARFGVEPENRIAMIMFDVVEFPIIFWGTMRAGAVPVLLNTLLTVEQYRYMLSDSRAKVAFVSAALAGTVQEAAKGIATLKAIVAVGRDAPETLPHFDKLLAAVDAPGEPAPTCPDDISYWQYSSGTTGMPKGVMHVHGTLRTVAQITGIGRLGMRADDVIFSAPKLFFAYGLNNSITCPMWVGATSVLYPNRPTPQAVFDIMRRHRPTVFYAVPTLYAMILASGECSTEGFERLRLCFSAGEPLPPHVGQSWKQRFAIDIVNGIGSTEMGHLYLTNLPDKVEYGTSGVPIDGYEMRLVDEHGNDVADGEIGEMWIKGSTSAAGYWNQREKTRRTFLGEWTRTGDKYLRRPDGVYIFCGRTDDMFKVSGIWVSPFEVEAALISHPRVLEAAVIPAEDGDGLVKPKAFVVLKQPLREQEGAGRALYEDLKTHVKRMIGPWKYPRWIEFVDNLPKTATGKIQRYKLRDLQGNAGGAKC